MLPALLLATLFLFQACRQEDFEINIDIDIRDPEITNLDDGSKKLDFTVVVTQLGNHYYQDFHFNFTEFGSSATLDSFSTALPTAREFIKRSIVVASGGDYWVEAFVGTESNGSSSGTLIKVPE